MVPDELLNDPFRGAIVIRPCLRTHDPIVRSGRSSSAGRSCGIGVRARNRSTSAVETLPMSAHDDQIVTMAALPLTVACLRSEATPVVVEQAWQPGGAGPEAWIVNEHHTTVITIVQGPNRKNRARDHEVQIRGMSWVQPEPVPRRIRRLFIALVAVLLAIVVVVAGIAGYSAFNSHLPFPTSDQLTEQVGALGKTIPLLDSLNVSEFESGLGCRAIVYAHGSFTNDTQFGCGLLYPASAHSFDPEASADFDATQRALNATGIGVMTVAYAPASDQGSRTYAFLGSCAGCPILNYVYAPGYSALPEAPAGKVRSVAVNADWYVWQDLDETV
jgi:hypothetical protein